MRTIGSSSARSEQLARAIAALGASLPVAVATIRALADRWVPVADQGIVATRAYDVFSGHSPLVGQYSLASDAAGSPTHSPGPLLYWLLAIPARAGAPASLTVTVALLNIACIAGIVALAARRGGTTLALLAGAGVLLVSRSLGPESLHGLFNPSAALFPFALLVFLCWSLACGEYRLLPVTVLAASFVVQCHLAFVAPVAGLLVIGGTGLRRAPPRWLAGALAVGLICWSAPLADQIAHRPGNLSLLAKAATSRRHTQGAAAGWRALGRAVGVPPRWLRLPSSRADRLSGISGGDYGDTRLDDVLRPLPALGTISSIAMLAALAVAAAAGVRRRRRALAAGAAIGLVLCAGLSAVVASTPARSTNTLGYTLWWGSIAGMWVWVFLAWAAGLRLPTRALAPAAGLLVAGAIVVVATTGHDQHHPVYAAARAASARALAQTHPGETVLVDNHGPPTVVPVLPAVMFDLRRQGVHPLGAALRLGPWYAIDHRRYDRTVTIGAVP